MGLSLLRHHKKRHNFIDTPSDKCLCNHGIEDTNHFLFSCPFFADQRVTLANSIIQILQKYSLNGLGNQSRLYLYGHQTINFDDNKKNYFGDNKIHKRISTFFNVNLLPYYLYPPLPLPTFHIIITAYGFVTTSITLFFSSIVSFDYLCM